MMQYPLTFAVCISLLLLPAARADFSFTLNIESHSTSFTCDPIIDTACETFFPFFCLRGPRESSITDETDCPLGKNSMVLDHNMQSGSRTIDSSQPWQGNFQLYIRAIDEDVIVNDYIGDIFANRVLVANSGVTPVEAYSGDGITIMMSFRVDCQANFFGPACTTACQPRDDDTNGHFTCNPSDGSHDCLPDYYGPSCLTFCRPSPGFYSCDQVNGSRICEPGFSIPNCQENINDCADLPCENQGNCTDMTADYSCTCAPGYTGKNCSVDIDECLTAECPGDSTCVEGDPGSFACHCNSGFEGENCTEIEPCDSSPCENGGLCVSKGPFEFSCECPLEFTGSTCEVALDVPDTANNVGLGKKNIILIGSVLGALVVAILLLILCILVCVLTRRKMTIHKGRRLSHNYESSPTLSKEKLASGLQDDDMDANPIYNDPSPKAEHTFSYSGSITSPGVRVVENSLYETNPSGDAVIYDQIGSKLGNESTVSDNDDSMTSSITANVAYATGRSKKQACIDNPVYGMPANTGTENPPVYSVPRPASPPNNHSYAPLSNSSTPSHASSTISPVAPAPKPQQLRYESIELEVGASSGSTEQTTQIPSGVGMDEKPPISPNSGYYAVPADVPSPQSMAVGPVSTGYSRLQHTEVKEGPNERLALESGTGYQALEKNH